MNKEEPSGRKSFLTSWWMYSIYGICFAVVLVFLLKGVFTESSSQTDINISPQDHSVAASIKAERFVAQALKAPSTAKFPVEATAVNLGEEKYLVTSYVDSDNSFGADLRSQWTATLRYLGGPESNTESWELVELTIDNIKVFPR